MHETRTIKCKYITAQYETKYGEVTRYRTFYKEQIKIKILGIFSYWKTIREFE